MPGCPLLSVLVQIGRAITPIVIYRGSNPLKPIDMWFPPCHECPNWWFGFIAKGWTNNSYSLNWLTNVFIPQTENQGKKRLLLLNGHGSHATPIFQWECLNNNIVFIYLLPHTSHLYQPYNLGPFARLKAEYAKNLQSFISIGRTEVDRAQFSKLYNLTRQLGMKKQYIIAD